MSNINFKDQDSINNFYDVVFREFNENNSYSSLINFLNSEIESFRFCIKESKEKRYIIQVRNEYSIEIKIIFHTSKLNKLGSIDLYMTSNKLCSINDKKGIDIYKEILDKRWLSSNIMPDNDNFLYFYDISTPFVFQEKVINLISALQDWDMNYYFSSKKVAIVDIETTGLVPRNSVILEIGVVELDIETGETKVLFNSLIKEPMFGEHHRGSWIFDNSDLKYEDILTAPTLEEKFEELKVILKKYRTTAFNRSFDFGFLKSRGFSIQKELPCIMLASTNICKIPHYSGRPGYKWPKAQEAWDYFFPNSAYIEKHRATDDAEHEAKILFELIKLGVISL